MPASSVLAPHEGHLARHRGVRGETRGDDGGDRSADAVAPARIEKVSLNVPSTWTNDASIRPAVTS
jgi:hypothetical protein